MKKTYVFDTSALIEIPDMISQFKRHNVFIPTPVIRQLDGLKNDENELVAYNARIASQYIEAYQGKNIRLISQWEPINILNNEADNQIVGSVVWLKRNGYDPILVSTDRNMRIVAREYGIKEDIYVPWFRRKKVWNCAVAISVCIFVMLLIIATLENVDYIVVTNSTEGGQFLLIAFALLLMGFIFAILRSVFCYNADNVGMYDNDYSKEPNLFMDPSCSGILGNVFHEER